MGVNSIKSNICGLGGKGCAIGDYPVCDRHRMIGVSRLPNEAPTNPGELRSWVNRWVDTVGNYGGICQQSGIWSVYYGSRESAPLDEVPLTPPIAVQAAESAKAETDQEIEDADEKPTGWKTKLVIAGASIFLGLSLVAGTALAWKRISKWRASKPIERAPPPPLDAEEAVKPEAIEPEAAKPEAATPEAAREVALEPVPIGPKAIGEGPYKAGDPMPEGVMKAIASIEQGFSTLPPNIQSGIAEKVWADASSAEENMRLFFREGRLTVDALSHWRALTSSLGSSFEKVLIGDREVTLGNKILPDNFQGNAEDYIPRIIEEMREIDTLFAKLPSDSQTRVASNIAQLPKSFQDGKLTVYAMGIGHGLARISAQKIAPLPADNDKADWDPTAAEADQPRVSKFVTRHIDASREGAIIHEKLMREFPDAKGTPFSFPSLGEGEREAIVEGILMQIEDSIERGTWREHFDVANDQRAFKPGALGRFLERHLETANHPSIGGLRNVRGAETRRVPERSDARRDNKRKTPPPPRSTDKPRGKPMK